MKKNIGPSDKIFRLLVTVVLLILYFTNIITGTLATVFLVVAIIMLLTSLTGICCLYILLGINTCKIKTSEDSEN